VNGSSEYGRAYVRACVRVVCVGLCVSAFLGFNLRNITSKPDFVGAIDDRIATIIATDPILEYPQSAYAAIASERG